MLEMAPSRRIGPDPYVDPEQPAQLSSPRDAGAPAAAYVERLLQVLPLVPMEAVGYTVSLLLEAGRRGRRIYVMGNGGSATTATHFACDLAKTAQVPGHNPLRAFALADNTALVTAWANDSSYDRIFAEQIQALVEPGDVVVAISASGNSPNVVQGLLAAAARGAQTVGMLGFDGGACRSLVDVALHVPCDHYGLVEDTHSAMTHAITAAVRHALEADARAQASPVVTGPVMSAGRQRE